MDLTDIRRGMLVQCTGYRGQACYVRRLETIPEHTCDDCGGHGRFAETDDGDEPECSRCDGFGELPEELTGRVVLRMVQDDHDFLADPDDIAPIDDNSFCRECGSMGCGHGREE